jgi:RHH-type proline utilization regulon transcriptional repressor/proline dehydrogenase/delta 1-pyrroline-5-carboxylate dehydrogenase
MAQGRLSLAHACARFAASSAAGLEAVLSGPTGERNVYRVQARQRVLCLSGQQSQAFDDQLMQLAAVLAVGSRAVWVDSLQILKAGLPQDVQASIDISNDLNSELVEVALIHGDETESLKVAADLARRPGPIVTLTALRPGDAAVPMARLLTERSISTNTSAAGGNASLMTLEG